MTLAETHELLEPAKVSKTRDALLSSRHLDGSFYTSPEVEALRTDPGRGGGTHRRDLRLEERAHLHEGVALHGTAGAAPECRRLYGHPYCR